MHEVHGQNIRQAYVGEKLSIATPWCIIYKLWEMITKIINRINKKIVHSLRVEKLCSVVTGIVK